jgi:hypothetical protein
MMDNIQKETKENRNYFFILVIISSIALSIRLIIIPYEVPISLDGLDYFAYSIAMSREGIFPSTYLYNNFGWPSLLSFIFSIVEFNQMLELMNIQKIISSLISVITVIPIYFICKKFFEHKIAILGSTLFLFEPRMIINSTLGITDSFFIFLIALVIMFIFIKNGRFYFLSFVFAAISVFVRYEGFLLIFPIVISFLIKKEFDKKKILHLSLGIIIFLTIILTINVTAYEKTGTSIFSPITGGVEYMNYNIIMNNPDYDDKFFGVDEENKNQVFIYNSLSGYLKFLGWTTLPYLIFFVIPGLYLMNKKLTTNKIIFIIFSFFISGAGFYAYGRGIEETRYLYPLIPIIILIGCKFIYSLNKKYDYRKLAIVIIFFVIISSVGYLEYKKNDNVYEREIYDATIFLIKIADGVNDYEGNKFVRTAALENSWPELLPLNEKNKMTANIKKFSSKNFENLEQFLENNKNKGLTHLVIIENDKELFLNKVFHNEKDYSFLEKIYDSKDLGFKNQIKIFEINYNIFNLGT